MEFTGDLLYVITMFAAKIAVAMLFLRHVASQREHFLVISLLIGGLVLGLPAFVLVAAQEAREAMVSLIKSLDTCHRVLTITN
jgi:RsiW-degrading membrane proteinase PrsW (M82 family)